MPPSRTRRPAPVVTRRADPLAWTEALRLADGDARRLVLLDDGAVLVLRQRRS